MFFVMVEGDSWVPVGDRCEWFHDLGRVRVSKSTYTPLRSWGTRALINRNDQARYHLALVTKGSMWISQRGNDSGQITDGDMVLFDTSHPFEAGTGTDGRLVETVVVQLERNASPLSVDEADQLLARRLPARQGLGSILGSFVSALGSHGSGCSPPELEQLGAVTFDLVCAYLGQHVNAYGELPAAVRARRSLSRINAFIDQNLADATLSPSVVAAHQHMSVRALHLLFEPCGEGVAAVIARRRLERCRTDLARPELADQPIAVVAARWGFASASVFSRAFRRAYGSSPREFRRLAVPRPAGVLVI